jgi:hypothetical protein
VRFVGQPVAFGVEADADDAEEALAVGLADVDTAAVAGEDDRDRRLGLVGDAERPGEVVAAAAGDQADRGLRAGQGAADRPHQAIAADHDGDLAQLDRAQRQADAVLEAAGALDPERGSASVEGGLDPGQQLQRLSPRRGGIDEQGQGHPGDLHRRPA